MTRIAPTWTSDRRLLAAGAGVAMLGLLVVMLTLVWPAPADSAGLRFVVLGKKVATLPPDCPETMRKGCQGVGRVTGFQSTAGGSRNQPFEAPFEGKVVSWSITLSRPNHDEGTRADPEADEVRFFNDYFGKPSQARISVLRRVRNTRPVQYRLVRQSPIQILNPYFGSTIEFALEHPLTVLKGHMVALTIPTWAPAFYHAAACEEEFPGILRDEAACEEFTANNSWRGSRRKGRCQFNADDPDVLQAQINKSYPQQRVGSKKEYGCYYKGARLIYTATVVKKPQRGGGGGDGGGGGGGSNRATASTTLAPDDNGVGSASEVTP